MKAFGRLLTALALVAVIFSERAEADSEAFETYGDIMQYVLPLSGFAATYITKDKTGRIQFLKQGALTMGTVSILKVTNEKWRPNAGNAQSWPSGHTAGAFWGASFLDMRYGYKVGIPAYALAALVGASRVDSQNHFADDTISGMSIALLSGWLTVTPFSKDVALQPFANAQGYGMTLTFGGLNLAAPEKPAGWEPRYRFEWEFGPSWTEEIEVTAPRATGTTFDIADTLTGAEQQITAQVSFYFFLDDRHEVMLRFFPWEVRDLGISATPIVFNTTTFPANTLLLTQYRAYDTRVRWRVSVLDTESRWDLKLGLGFAWQDTKVRLESGTATDSVADTGMFPLAHLHVAFALSPKWKLFLEGDGMALGDEHTVDGAILLRHQINHHWDIGIGYRIWNRRITSPALKNSLLMHWGVISLGYTW